MGKRHDAIGIKQVIRLEWLGKAANLMLAGLETAAIRQELHDFLANKKGSGAKEERGATSRSQVVNILMNIWVTPDQELVPFRDAGLAILRTGATDGLAVHWSMISAAYPFWFNAALQVGRLLNLQDQMTKLQMTARLKEVYGDRETVIRYARNVIRSFVAWGVLEDADSKGTYQRAEPRIISDNQLNSFLLEAALYARPEGKAPLAVLVQTPAFFPFQLSANGNLVISHYTDRVEVVRYGLDEEMLGLRG